MTDRVILGVGQMAIDGRVIENPTTFEITVEYEDISLPNTGTPGGGEYVKKSRISTIGFTATIHDYSASTLAKLLAGEASAVATAAIVDESLIASLGKLVATANVIDTTQTVTVTDDPMTVTYVQDTDYAVSAAGIRALSGGAISDLDALLITYTSYDVGKVEMATQIPADVAIIFDGWNDQESVPVVGEFYKVSLRGDGGLPLISTDAYGEATLAGSMLQDTTKPAGVSKFGKLSVGGVPFL